MFAINTNENTIKVARELASQLEKSFTLDACVDTGGRGDYIVVDGKDYSSFIHVDFKYNKADSYTLKFKTRKEQCDWLRDAIQQRC